MVLNPIVFEAYNEPQGFLVPDFGCHGLMYYSLIGKSSYEQVTASTVLIGDRDPHADFRQLFKSVSVLYGVEPEDMFSYWTLVLAQWNRLELTPPPAVVIKATTTYYRTTDNPTDGIGFRSLKDLESSGKLEEHLRKFGIDFNDWLKR